MDIFFFDQVFVEKFHEFGGFGQNFIELSRSDDLTGRVEAKPTPGGRIVEDDAVLNHGIPEHDEQAERKNFYLKSESTKSSGENSRRSSMDSPIPINRTGMPSSWQILNNIPPLAVPSSFVTISPVIPVNFINSRA